MSQLMSRRRRPCFFKILIFDFSTHLRIPHAFAKNFEADLPRTLPQEFVLETLTSAKRFWHVDLDKGDDNCFYFGKGWNQFVQQNSLQNGDLVVFRYYGRFRFKLEIYGTHCCKKGVLLDDWKKLNCDQKRKRSEDDHFERSDEEKWHKNVEINMPENAKKGCEGFLLLNDYENGGACEVDHVEISDEDGDDDEVDDDQESLQSTAVGLEAAEEFNSRYPFFKVIIQPAYLSFMSVPRSFVRTNPLKPKGQKIKLQVSDKTWYVKMSDVPYYTRFISGWSNFVKDNSVQKEDVCLFELIDNNDITFRVTIFRKD